MAVEERMQQETDLVLPMGTHALILDTTKGNVNVYAGPMKQPLSPKQEVPVVMNTNGRFTQVALDQAIKNNVVARKGEYLILNNPAANDKKPRFGAMSTPEAELLRMGESINIPGPVSFVPWPGQLVQVVPGHHLKSNQYLLVRVTDEEAARANWRKATIKLVEVKSTPSTSGIEPIEDDAKESLPKVEARQEIRVSDIDPSTLTIGQQLNIKGTEVSFYIPPTGIEVVKDGESYVREALTLEALEYCLLLDEDGNKRYERGPQVIFPAPTETFKLNEDKDRKSRAYELNEISGLHIKVISPYTDSYGEEHIEGEELFITGRRSSDSNEEETQIYFPRVEHALLKYGGRTRYHAVAIPPGEARYVMNRLTGVVRLESGPSMFLPDPRKEVIVKRILSENEVATYYPGNSRVATYNQSLREQNKEAETAAALTGMPSYRTGHASTDVMAAISNYADTGDKLLRGSRSADAIDRGTKFTPPREIILDGKYDGAVQVSPWTGYAIQVVDQAGRRRVEVGPKTVQLAFDERLEVLSLSTGTPKSADKPMKTVYLRIANNAVSDTFMVRSKDMVTMVMRLKYLVRFDVDKGGSWFNIDNYVQNMVDRFRSLVNNYARTVEVRQLFTEAGSLLRDLILGKKDGSTGERPGFLFGENGMLVHELDVLGADIMDDGIATSMKILQNDRIKNGLEVERSASNLELVSKKEANERDAARARHLTTVEKNAIARKEAGLNDSLRLEELEATNARSVLQIEGEVEVAEKRIEIAIFNAEAERKERAAADEAAESELSRRIKLIIEETKGDETRSKAIQPQLTAALIALAQTGALQLVAGHLGDLAIIRQQSLGGVFEAVFQGTPLEGMLENLKKLGTGAVVATE